MLTCTTDEQHCQGMRLHAPVPMKYNGQVLKHFINYCTPSK